MTEQERRDPRYPSLQGLQVRCESWGEFAELYAADVSRGGMFILTDRALPILSEVEVALRLPEGHEIQLKATVVHVIDAEQAARENKRAGLGVQFTQIDALRKRQIQQLVMFAHEASSADNGHAILASRMFEAAASLPPSRVLEALPSNPAQEDAHAGASGEAHASQRAQPRPSQSSPRISLRAGTSTNPGERRASRKTGEDARRATAPGERRPSRRTGEQSIADDKRPPRRTGEELIADDKRAARRTAEEFVPKSTSQQPAAGASESPRRNSLPALEPEAAETGAPAAPKALKPLDPAKLKLGMTHVAHRRFEHAIKVFEELVAESGDKQAQHWLHMSRARLQLKNNDDDGAANHYQKALEVDESNHEARKFVRQHRHKKRLNAMPFGRYFMKKD